MQKYIGYLTVSTAIFTLITVSSMESSRIKRGDFFVDPNTALNLEAVTVTPTIRSAPRSSCDIARDNCGQITPSSVSVFIADGAYNSTDHTIFFVDVPSGSDGIFQFDPMTCAVMSGTYYSINYGLSQRGIAFDPNRYQVWAGGWGDYILNQHEATPPYSRIQSNYIGHGITGAAVDPLSDFLFIGNNEYPDMLYVYDISSGYLGSMLGSWSIPWQTESDGYDMAGMGFDDDSGRLIMVNQFLAGPGIVRESFDFDISIGLIQTGYCSLDNTGYAWGMAVVEDGYSMPDTYNSFHPDITGFGPPFDVDEYGIWVEAPYELVCTVSDDNGVGLTWINADIYDSINLYRDDELIEELDGDATYYFDPDPGVIHHLYGVSGVIGLGESFLTECEVDLYPRGLICFDFNSSDCGWETGGVADWEWGATSYAIDGNGWETIIGDNYLNNSCGWLDSPGIELGPDGGWLYFESADYVEDSWDGWNVQVSSDGGSRWSTITPEEGYDQGVPDGACDEGLGGNTNAHDDFFLQRGWNFDLSAYSNTTVRIRFLFESDSSVSRPGVVIDNVCMMGSSADIEISIVPVNPPVEVYPGEQFRYHAGIVNNHVSGQYADVWLNARLPGGSYYNVKTYKGPSGEGLHFQPTDTTVILNISQYVPRFVTPGLYTYIAYVGDYPVVKYDSSYFDIEVLQGFVGEVDSWELHGWTRVSGQNQLRRVLPFE
jgi:hypothetical protein